MTRQRQLGDLGEKWTKELLGSAGFTSVQDLNTVKYNHPGGDYLAERLGKQYFVTVKARNKYKQGTQKLNSAYNIFPLKVRAAAEKYPNTIPSWLLIQVDTNTKRFSAYFGTIDALANPNSVSVPMSGQATSKYECLAKDRLDEEITESLSNQLVENI